MFEDIVLSFRPQIELVKYSFDSQEKVQDLNDVVEAYISVFGHIFNYIFDDLFGSPGMEEEHYNYIKSLGIKIKNETIPYRFTIGGIRNAFNTESLYILKCRLTEVMFMNSLQKSLQLLNHEFKYIFSNVYGYYSFVYYSLRTTSTKPEIMDKIKKVQRFICDLYLNSELYCFPFMSYAEQFFFAFRKSTKICVNNFLSLILAYIPKYQLHDGNKEDKIIRIIDLENGIQIRFLNKKEGINNGMKIVAMFNNSSVEWYYKSFHLSSIAKKKDHQVRKNSSDFLSVISFSTPFSNSHTTVPIFGLNQAFINFREPLLYVILYGLGFGPFTFFHINLFAIGGFFIVSKGLSDHDLWSVFIKKNGIQKLNEKQRSCLAERILEISILSSSFGLHDLHTNNVMIKIDGDDVSLKIIDFAYCDDNLTVPSIITLKASFYRLIKIIRDGSLEDMINFNHDHSYLRFLSPQDYESIFIDWKLHCCNALESLKNRINGIINKQSIMLYYDEKVGNCPLDELLTGSSEFSMNSFSSFAEFVLYQTNFIRTTMETTIILKDFFYESSSKPRMIYEYIGFTNLESIQRIVPYFFCKEDTKQVKKCNTVDELLVVLGTTVSPDCGFKRRHIDRIYSYSMNEFQKFSHHIVDCFHEIISI